MESKELAGEGKNNLPAILRIISGVVSRIILLYGNRKILNKLRGVLKTFDDCKVLSDGYVAVKNGIGWGVVNREGEEIVPKEYLEIIELGNGVFACLKSRRDKWSESDVKRLKKDIEGCEDKFTRTIYNGNKIIGDEISNLCVKDGNIYVRYKIFGHNSTYQILGEDGNFKYPKKYFGIFGSNDCENNHGFKLDKYGNVVGIGEEKGKKYYGNEKWGYLKNLGFVFYDGKVRFKITYGYAAIYYAKGEFKDGIMMVEDENGNVCKIDKYFNFIK